MTQGHRPGAPPLLAGGQEQAVEHRHLVPEVISALVYPGKEGKGTGLTGKTGNFGEFIDLSGLA